MEANFENQHGIAAQQDAARDYEPLQLGPMVGNRLPCSYITEEYAKADPVYVDKTIALLNVYSHYRPIRGDGNCGWRAIGFSYFEKLVDSGDASRLEGEIARLISFNPLLTTVGGYDWVEDYADGALDLLRQLSTKVGDIPSAHEYLHQQWNDPSVTESLIYYLRLVAATHLKINARDYSNFIEGGLDIPGYCRTNIEPINREIEQIGVLALVKSMLEPIDAVLEVAYLDRSPGPQVTQHRFSERANEPGYEPSSSIHLLYRPDHYDILYRHNHGPVLPSHATEMYQVSLPMPANVEASPAASGNLQNMDLMAMIPGFGYYNTEGRHHHFLDPFAAQPGIWAPDYTISPVTTASLSTHEAARPPPTASNDSCAIRFSQQQYEYNATASEQGQVLTSPFKHSRHNPAHFDSDDFHPEEYNPLRQTTERKGASKRQRRGSRGSGNSSNTDNGSAEISLALRKRG